MCLPVWRSSWIIMFHVQGSTASGVKAEASDSSKMDNGGGKSKCAIAVCTHLYLLALCRETNVTPLFLGVPTYIPACTFRSRQKLKKLLLFFLWCFSGGEGRGSTHLCLLALCRETNVTRLFWVCPLTYLLALLEVGKSNSFCFVFFLVGGGGGDWGVYPLMLACTFVGRPT